MFAREAVFLFGAAAAGEKYTLYIVVIPWVRSVFGSWGYWVGVLGSITLSGMVLVGVMCGVGGGAHRFVPPCTIL